MWCLKKSSGETYPRVSYKQQLLLIMKIDSLSLCWHYLNIWEEQNEVPWSLSLALYLYKFKAECRTSSLFCLPTAFQFKTCCKLKSIGIRLYCFISVPSSHQDKVGRRIQSSQTIQIPVLNLLSCEGGWVNRYTLPTPQPPRNQRS